MLTFNRIKTLCLVKKQLAFTLAEVLITLTIIGVIAAITIPNLMQSWRKHERITQIKTAYSILSNALKMSIAENGSPDEWTSSKSHDVREFAEKYMAPYLKIKDICGTGDMTRNSDTCFEQKRWYSLNGEIQSSAFVGNYWYMIKLENGMDMAFHHSPNGERVYIAVDVNGRQGPTKAGVDVFGFQADLQSGKGIIKTNVSNDTIFRNYRDVMTSGLYQCNTTSGNMSGLNCTHLLELNHWEFPDDYPVKKF